ncbi:MAG: DUF1501 domain-containing protein [Candidatus Aminicenantes bacterium]|nr:DUF1501 domain-containing protein [Candidatus Aminicenantes bacterium]
MKEYRCFQCRRTRLGRRDFLRVGSLSFLGMNAGDLFRLERLQAASNAKPAAGQAQACILLFLEGGPSQMDTWDPKGNTNFGSIATNVDGIRISELLPKTAQHMDKLSLIRSMRTQETNHPQGTIESLTGHRPSPTMKFPGFGSIVAKEMGARNNMPPFTTVPMPWENDFYNYEEAFKGSYIGAEYDAMVLPDPSGEEFVVPDLRLPKTVSAAAIEDRKTLLSIVDRHYRSTQEVAEFGKMDTYREQALGMILSPHVQKAFDLSSESEKTRDAYGRHRFGQSVLMARRLVEAGCRFVTAAGYKHGQWDTHGSNDKRMKEDLTPPLDKALSALLEDLDQRGLWESTVVLVMGEFGRTPHINPGLGRDHWPHCWSLALGGGGIQGGQVIGVSDDRAAYVAERPISIGDLYATIYKALGIDWTKTYMAPVGRPVYIANGFDDTMGQPIPELI